MDGRYSRAMLFAALFACVLIAGCHSGGTTTAPLVVVTTSLPPAVQNTPYSATLQGSGGTAPYTWSQTAGGAMPPGMTVSAAGNFTGTPTKVGTFGPFTFKVTDSVGDTATSAGISITIKSSNVAVSTSSLPNGSVGIAYSAKLSASGGTSPYSWSESSGGAMPPGLATVTSDGVIAGTPTTAGTYGPYVFTVTDTKGTTAVSAPLSITISGTSSAVCTPIGNEGALTPATPYAFLLKGTDGNGNPIDIAGSFTPDGAGGIASAAADYNGLTNGPEPLAVDLAGSSYAFGTSAQGCLYLAFSGLASADERKANTSDSSLRAEISSRVRKTAKPAISAVPVSSVKFNFYLSGLNGTVYNTGRIIESDNTAGSGTNASGFMRVQVPANFVLTALQSNYAFGVDGWTAATSGVARTAMAGSFTNSAGTLSAGYADLNTGGTVSGELTGGYGVLNGTIDASTGRGTGSFFTTTPTGKLTFDFAFYVLNGSDLILLSTDLANAGSTTPLFAGRALASNATSSAASLSGYYLLASQGLQTLGINLGNVAEIGTFNADGVGTLPTATIYANNAGTYTSNQYPGSSFSVEAPSGRVSISGLTQSSPVLYLSAGATADDGIAAFLLGTDTQASSGVVVMQSATAPAYGVGNVTGTYAASTGEDIDGSNGAFLGAFGFDAVGGYVVTAQSTGTVPSVPSPGSIAVNGDGSGNLNGGQFPLVTNGSVVFAIPDSGDPLLYVLEAVTP
jgi:large repetitive protein